VTDQKLTVAEAVAKMVDIRNERRTIAKRDKELTEAWRLLEFDLIARLDEQGMEKASTGVGTATITETILPQVVDWDEFYEYMVETDQLHLLQKRPAAAAFRELLESGEQPKGVEPYTQRSIGLRKA
jgi:hypothetical protein